MRISFFIEEHEDYTPKMTKSRPESPLPAFAIQSYKLIIPYNSFAISARVTLPRGSKLLLPLPSRIPLACKSMTACFAHSDTLFISLKLAVAATEACDPALYCISFCKTTAASSRVIASLGRNLPSLPWINPSWTALSIDCA